MHPYHPPYGVGEVHDPVRILLLKPGSGKRKEDIPVVLLFHQPEAGGNKYRLAFLIYEFDKSWVFSIEFSYFPGFF